MQLLVLINCEQKANLRLIKMLKNELNINLVKLTKYKYCNYCK